MGQRIGGVLFTEEEIERQRIANEEREAEEQEEFDDFLDFVDDNLKSWGR